MSRLLKFIRLSSSDRMLLTQALLLVCAARLSLWFIPFDRVRRRADRLATARPFASRPESAEKLVGAVEATARCVPSATCLTQAFAAQILLRQSGYPAALRVGVLRSQTEGFKAHAWVECEGRTVIGELPNLADFKRLPSIR